MKETEKESLTDIEINKTAPVLRSVTTGFDSPWSLFNWYNWDEPEKPKKGSVKKNSIVNDFLKDSSAKEKV